MTRPCHCDTCHLCDVWRAANGLPAVPRPVLAGAVGKPVPVVTRGLFEECES